MYENIKNKNMKTFKQFFLKEDPDTIITGSKELYMHDSGTITFGITPNNSVIYYMALDDYKSKKIAIYPTHKILAQIINSIDKPNNMEHEYIKYIYHTPNDKLIPPIHEVKSREDFITGRVWTKEKYISFWEPKDVVIKHLKNITQFLKDLNLNPADVKFEFLDMQEQFIPYKELSLDHKSTSSEEEQQTLKGKEHILSPLLKQQKKPSYYKNRPKGLLPGQKWWALKSEAIIKDYNETFKQHFLKEVMDTGSIKALQDITKNTWKDYDAFSSMSFNTPVREILNSLHNQLYNYKIVKVPVSKIKPSQSGEDYINDSSKNSAEMIKQGTVKRLNDLMPIILDKDYNIDDGNHRHAAAILNNQKEIYALVPVSKGNGKVTNMKQFYNELIAER